MAIYPLADFILKDDGAWEDFVDFFTSEKETASGTPYIDCYDIREVDYVAVPCEEALKENLTTCDMFQLLWEHLIAEKFEIFLVTPDCYTIRARFPEGYKYQGVADFVMARKEVGVHSRYQNSNS